MVSIGYNVAFICFYFIWYTWQRRHADRHFVEDREMFEGEEDGQPRESKRSSSLWTPDNILKDTIELAPIPNGAPTPDIDIPTPPEPAFQR